MASDLRECAGSDDRRATLEALRDHLIRTLADEATAREVAGLAGRLVEVLAEIDALPNGKEVSTLDDLAARRASRRADTSASSRPASGK